MLVTLSFSKIRRAELSLARSSSIGSSPALRALDLFERRGLHDRAGASTP